MCFYIASLSFIYILFQKNENASDEPLILKEIIKKDYLSADDNYLSKEIEISSPTTTKDNYDESWVITQNL